LPKSGTLPLCEGGGTSEELEFLHRAIGTPVAPSRNQQMRCKEDIMKKNTLLAIGFVPRWLSAAQGPVDSPMGKPTYWQLVFLQSKVNGASYNGEALPQQIWDWPKETYFQRRLNQINFLKPFEPSNVN
jgi:hypothetical protein